MCSQKNQIKVIVRVARKINKNHANSKVNKQNNKVITVTRWKHVISNYGIKCVFLCTTKFLNRSSKHVCCALSTENFMDPNAIKCFEFSNLCIKYKTDSVNSENNLQRMLPLNVVQYAILKRDISYKYNYKNIPNVVLRHIRSQILKKIINKFVIQNLLGSASLVRSRSQIPLFQYHWRIRGGACCE